MPRRKEDPANDPAYLVDMRVAGEAVMSFVQGKTREDYRRDLLLRSAVERQIEIVGEAARLVTKAFQEAHPDIPWSAIQAQRHRLAHEYGVIDDDLIWKVATVHVPALVAQLTRLLTAP